MAATTTREDYMFAEIQKIEAAARMSMANFDDVPATGRRTHPASAVLMSCALLAVTGVFAGFSF